MTAAAVSIDLRDLFPKQPLANTYVDEREVPGGKELVLHLERVHVDDAAAAAILARIGNLPVQMFYFNNVYFSPGAWAALLQIGVVDVLIGGDDAHGTPFFDNYGDRLHVQVFKIEARTRVNTADARRIFASTRNHPTLRSLRINKAILRYDDEEMIKAPLVGITYLHFYRVLVPRLVLENIAQNIGSVRSLSFAFGELDDGGAIIIARGIGNLDELDLGYNEIGDAGIEAICANGRNLRSLDVGTNRFTTRGFRAIAELVRSTTRLRRLHADVSGRWPADDDGRAERDSVIGELIEAIRDRSVIEDLTLPYSIHAEANRNELDVAIRTSRTRARAFAVLVSGVVSPGSRGGGGEPAAKRMRPAPTSFVEARDLREFSQRSGTGLQRHLLALSGLVPLGPADLEHNRAVAEEEAERVRQAAAQEENAIRTFGSGF